MPVLRWWDLVGRMLQRCERLRLSRTSSQHGQLQRLRRDGLAPAGCRRTRECQDDYGLLYRSRADERLLGGQMKPRISILDRAFAYRNSVNTDVAATFARIREEQRAASQTVVPAERHEPEERSRAPVLPIIASKARR